MNKMMPDAPEPRLPQAAPIGPPPGSVPAPPPSPEHVKMVHGHFNAFLDGLIALVSKPRGQLHKKAVFDTAATAISQGAFPTPESKQTLVVELTKLPDDEGQLRKYLAQWIVQAAAKRAQVMR